MAKWASRASAPKRKIFLGDRGRRTLSHETLRRASGAIQCVRSGIDTNGDPLANDQAFGWEGNQWTRNARGQRGGAYRIARCAIQCGTSKKIEGRSRPAQHFRREKSGQLLRAGPLSSCSLALRQSSYRGGSSTNQRPLSGMLAMYPKRVSISARFRL